MKTNTLSTSVPNSYYPGNSLPAGLHPYQLWQRLAFFPCKASLWLSWGDWGLCINHLLFFLFLLFSALPRLRCMTDAFVPTAILGENNPLTQSLFQEVTEEKNQPHSRGDWSVNSAWGWDGARSMGQGDASSCEVSTGRKGLLHAGVW